MDRNSAISGGTDASDGYYDVDYTWEKAVAGRNTVRKTTMVMPEGSTLTYEYLSTSSLHDADASRVTRVKVSTTAVATYAYNGLGQLVGTSLPQPDVFMTLYDPADLDDYDRIDNFGRVTQCKWTRDLATDRDFYHTSITWDRNSRGEALGTGHLATGRGIPFDARGRAHGEEGRIGSRDRSTALLSLVASLGASPRGGSAITSRTREQNWTLDQVGNWSNAKLDLDGNNNWSGGDEYNDSRTHNVANELLARDTNDDSTDEFDLVYDAVGNLTDDGEAYEYVYDAWGRLRKVLNTSTQALIEEFWYNGLGFRITFHADANESGAADGSDPKYHLIHDERWRLVATYRGDDDNPKEAFVPHQAGLDGSGSSSYIDSVILRQRDANSGWVNAADGTMEERRNYCQNWRSDVSALLTSAGVMVEWGKFTAYGMGPQSRFFGIGVPLPIGLPAGDRGPQSRFDVIGVPFDSDFITDTGDVDTIKTWVAAYDVRADLDLDGDIDATDGTLAGGYSGRQLAWTVLSDETVANRIGYAGYHKDVNLDISHVRNRVLEPHLGRWTRRDPLKYVDGMGQYEYVGSSAQSSIDGAGETRYIIIFEGNRHHNDEWGRFLTSPREGVLTRWPYWVGEGSRSNGTSGENEFHRYVHYDDAKAWNDLKRNVLDNYTPYQRYDDCLYYPTIYVLGWSMGGDAAINLINRLVREDVCIFAGGVIADPIPRGLGTLSSAIFGANYRVNTAPGLVKNYYQRVALLKGWWVDGADNTQLSRSDFVDPSDAHYEIALRNEAEGRHLGPTPCKYAVGGVVMGAYYLPPPGVHCDQCSGFSSDPDRPCWKCPGVR